MKGYTAGKLFRCKESRVPKEMPKVYLDNEAAAEVEAQEAQLLHKRGGIFFDAKQTLF